MTNSKSTKRALLTSALAMLMCVAMLIGTTFAWFTDTASTAVNKIQSGTLDVALEMKNPDYGIDGKETKDQEWISAEGKTLEFKKAAGAAENEAVLWEPGCTYELPELRVVNNGNLALKYKVIITGIKGDAKLNEAIEWTISDTALDSDHSLAANATSETLTIKGHMKEEAGNEYQNLSINGIAITVYATQNTVEYDSNDNQYDKNAFDALAALYPVYASAEVTTDGASITTDTVSVTIPKEAIEDGATNVAVTVTKSADVNSTFTLSSGENTTVQQFDVKVTGIKDNNSNEIEVKMFIGKGYDFSNQDAVAVQHLKADGSVEDLTGSYNKETGFVTFKTTSFSPFAVATPNVDAVVGTGKNTTYYAGLTEAVAAGGEITLLRDVSLNATIIMGNSKEITINGGNYKVECTDDGVLDVRNGTLVINGGSYHATNKTSRIYAAVYACGTATVTINDGTFNGGIKYGNEATTSIFACEEATVNICGGTFTNDDDSQVIYAAASGRINISGGFFKSNGIEKNGNNVLNVQNNTKATINVSGGTFVNQNPSSGDDSGKPSSFVEANYEVKSETQSNGDVWYTVVYK